MGLPKARGPQSIQIEGLRMPCVRLACDLWMGPPAIRAHLWCAFLIMSGRENVNARLGERNCLRDKEAVIHEKISARASAIPPLTAMSIAPGGPPPYVRLAQSAALAYWSRVRECFVFGAEFSRSLSYRVPGVGLTRSTR